MGHEKFKPRTRVHESWNMNNSGDVYNAICRMAQSGSNQELVGKHIGLNFPKQMECFLYLEHGGRHLTFNIEPVVDRTQCIIDALGYDMRRPDVVLTTSDRYGYVTAYSIFPYADYDINGSITFNIDDLISVQFQIFAANKKDSLPWYKRLFS
jgi:hypothetical protein